MDLIYANSKKEDIGVMKNYTFDLAYGTDENDFELKTNISNHVCEEGFILYIEGTEYGGVIDGIRVKTSSEELYYIGKTWHGILQSKVIEPDAGEDYLVCDGEANEVLGSLIERMGLADLFKASDSISDITINNYQMHRYIDGYEGIKKMLSSVGGKLKIYFQNGFVVLSAETLIDYSTDEEFDSSQIDFDVKKHYKPVNHMICLGKGELKDRTVIHLYADSKGNISRTQTLFGLDEVASVYDNANCESDEELEQGGRDVLEEAWASDSLQVNFEPDKIYDIGDIVGARENITGIFVSKEVSKKIVTIQDDKITVSHKVGE